MLKTGLSHSFETVPFTFRICKNLRLLTFPLPHSVRQLEE